MEHKKLLPAGVAMGVSVLIALGYLFVTVDFTPDRTQHRASDTANEGRQGILSMKPHGDSQHVVSGPGEVASFVGDGFTTHIRYTDGHECTLNDPQHPCVAGPMLYEYVHDETGKPNNVSFVLHKP